MWKGNSKTTTKNAYTSEITKQERQQPPLETAEHDFRQVIIFRKIISFYLFIYWKILFFYVAIIVLVRMYKSLWIELLQVVVIHDTFVIENI